MFEGIMKHLECEFCGKPTLRFDTQATYHSYMDPNLFVLENVDKLVDGIIGEYLMYTCHNCKSSGKYTLKEIEKKIRKEISKQVLTAVATQQMREHNFYSKEAKVLIYCGKCNGLDGKGSCLTDMYKKCKIKRLPYELQFYS